MTKIKELSHYTIYKDPLGKHCNNQVVIKQLQDGQLMAVF